MYKFYLPEYNSAYLTGQIGGDITATLYTGYIGELLATITNAPTGNVSGIYQYRKLFIKNEYSSTTTSTRVWIDSVEHSGQVSIALASGIDYISNSDEAPTISGWSTATNWSDGIEIGTMPSNSYTGIWIREYLSGISQSDPYATFRIGVGGLI